MARVILSLLISILILTSQLYAVAISDAQTINGVTFNQPWYEVKNIAGNATIFLIDNDGDMYLDADAINVSSTITGPFANSLVVQNATDEIFVINATNAYFSGKVYPNYYTTLPTMSGDDLVIQNAAGTPIAIFEGTSGTLYLSGDATHDAVTAEPRNALEFAGATRAGGLYPVGTHEYVSLPSMAIDFSAGFTFEGWFYWDALQTWAHPVRITDGTNSFQLLHYNANATLRFNTVNSTSSEWIESTGIIELNKWTHIAYTATPTGGGVATGRVYKNGKLIDTNTGQRSFPNTTWTTGMFAWGSATDGNMSFDGKLDEFRFWNDVRSQSEIQADMFTTYGTLANSGNLAAYWDFNDVLGSQLIDGHSGGFHGTLQEMNSDAWVSTFTTQTVTPTAGTNGAVSPAVATTVAETQAYPIYASTSSNHAFMRWQKTAGAGTVTWGDSTLDTTTVALSGGAATIQAVYEVYTDWTYNRTIGLNTTPTGANVTSTVTNFPVLIRLNQANFDFTQTMTNGEDIRFAEAGGDALSYEIERWDNSNKLAEIWVKVPSITGNATTNITMYWGEAGSTDRSNSELTFDTGDNFAGVWHLEEDGNTTAGGYIDATINGYDGTGISMTTGSDETAAIGSGQRFDGTSDYITLPSNVDFLRNVSAHTLSGWVKFDNTGNQAILGLGINGAGGLTSRGELQLTTGGYFRVGGRDTDGGSFLSTSKGIYTIDTWYHFVGVTDIANDEHRIYINGVLVGSGTPAFTNANTDNTTTGSATIAIQEDLSSEPFDGVIDEIRVEHTERSAAWIKLAYENQKAANTLVDMETYSSWSNSKTFSLNTTATYADVASDVTNFPVVFRLTSSDLTFADAETNGEDLRFEDGSGNHLRYEIERWNAGSSLAEVWVKVPTVTGNATTTVKMWWNKTGAPSRSSGEDVFETSNNFESVWHLSETGNTTTGGYGDATGNNVDLTGTNMDAADGQTSLIGFGSGFNGTDEYLQSDVQVVSAYPFTVSGWGYITDLNDSRTILMFADKSESNVNYQVRWSSTNLGSMRARNTTETYSESGVLAINTWYHYSAVYTNATTRILYVNGVSVDTSTTSVSYSSGVDRVSVGRSGDSSPGYYWQGRLDEVRVASATRSTDWIKLSYMNQRIDDCLMSVCPTGDITAPKKPETLWTDGSSSFDLVWFSAYDSVGVTGYKVFRGNTEMSDQTDTSYTVSSPTGFRRWRVVAYDAAGNESDTSQPVYFVQSESYDNSYDINVYDGYYVGDIDDDAGTNSDWLTWSNRRSHGGVYRFADRMASNDGTYNTQMLLWVNNSWKSARDYHGHTGGWTSWQVKVDNDALVLPTGTYEFKITFVGINWNSDWWDLWPLRLDTLQIADGELTGATYHTTYVLLQSSGDKICWDNVLVNNLTYAKVMYSTGEADSDNLLLKYNGTTKATFNLTGSSCGAWAGDCAELTAGFTSTSGRGEVCLEGSGGNWIASIAHVIIGEWY